MISVMFGSKAIFQFHRCRLASRLQRHKIVPFTTVLLLPWLMPMYIVWQLKISLSHQNLLGSLLQVY